ncbi:MAG: universal stress protein [Thalassovita sp.]
MSNIIALVDGSEYSESVCHYASWVAGRIGASVDLYHVLGRREGGNEDLSGSLKLGARTQILDELVELDAKRAKLSQIKGRAILDDAKALVEGDGVGDVTPHLRMGDIVETVTSQETGCELIIVGKRGEAADFAKLHLGSNLERVARAAHKPVLVANRAFAPVTSVLIAYDGGASSLKAVDYVAHNPLFKGLACTVVTVGTPTAEIQAGLEKAQAILAAGGHEASTKSIEGQPEKALSSLIDADGFDLLVMGAYGHSRIRNLIIGSTTEQMLRTCKVPVVLMK